MVLLISKFYDNYKYKQNTFNNRKGYHYVRNVRKTIWFWLAISELIAMNLETMISQSNG